jgi:hypothetical protein
MLVSLAKEEQQQRQVSAVAPPPDWVPPLVKLQRLQVLLALLFLATPRRQRQRAFACAATSWQIVGATRQYRWSESYHYRYGRRLGPRGRDRCPWPPVPW